MSHINFASCATKCAKGKAGAQNSTYYGHKSPYNHILQYIVTLDSGDIFLNESELRVALHHGWSFLRWYQYFAKSFFEEGRCGYKLRPKLHGFAHQLLELADTRENPSKYALWLAEDLVGQVKKIGRKTHKRTTHLRVAQRRSLMVSLRARQASRVFKPRMKSTLMN